MSNSWLQMLGLEDPDEQPTGAMTGVNVGQEASQPDPQGALQALIAAQGAGAPSAPSGPSGAPTGVNVARAAGSGGRMTASDDDDSDQSQPADSSDEAPAPSVPGTTSGNILDIRDQLQKYLQQQGGGIDNMQKLAELYKTQLAQQGSKANLSPLNTLADYYYGTNFAKNLAPPPTPAEQTAAQMKAEDLVNKQRQPVTQDLLKEYGADNSALGKAQAQYYRGLNSMASRGEKDDKQLDTMEEHMAKAMNPMGAAYGGAGNANLGQKLARARSVTALIRQHPDYNVDPRESTEMAMSVAGLLSNSNRVPVEMVQKLIPHTYGGDIAKWSEYMTNHPTNTDTQAFVKRLMNTAQKEQDTATEEIRAIQRQQAEGFHSLAIKRPDRFEAHVRAGENYLSMPNLDQLPVPGAQAAAGGKPKLTPDLTPPVQGAIRQVNKRTGEVRWKMPDGSFQKVQ